jgi:hypothetical protein
VNPTCIDLRDLAGPRRLKLAFDPAYDPHRKHRRLWEPWVLTIPCRFGIVYPHGGGKECRRSPFPLLQEAC